MYLVYKHTSPSGKSYIGYTSNYEQRCVAHQRPHNMCRAFAAAIKKYGWDNFLHEVLYDNLTASEATRREKQSINEYGTMVPFGYNLTAGGDGGKLCELSRARLSAALRGRIVSDETKVRMSIAHMGKHTGPKSDSHRQKLAEVLRRVKPNGERLKGYKEYTLKDPHGNVHIVTHMVKFCKERGLVCSNMYSVISGKLAHYKGWTVP